jgi:tetratricopeptide (TPR) repeat protein
MFGCRNLFLGLCMLLCLIGCKSSSIVGDPLTFSNSSADPIAPSGYLSHSSQAKKEFGWGRDAAAKREWRKAIALYEVYLRRYPGHGGEEQARYETGRCYLELRDYHRALGRFQTYLKKFPAGRYVDPMLVSLLDLKREVQAKADIRKQQDALLASRIAKLSKMLSKGASSADRWIELGDMYWAMHAYSDARDAYAKALKMNPKYWDSHNLEGRLYLDRKGHLQVRPPMLSDDDLYSGDVRVVNYSSFVMEDRDAERGDRSRLRVTGKAVNVSDNDLASVELEITLQDLFGNVVEAQTVRIGRLRSKQERAFSTSFKGFDGVNIDVFNVDRVKIKAVY